MSEVIRPGATLGVFGGGQLGRMFTLAASAMGYRVGVFDPEPDSPAGQVAAFQVVAEFDDLIAVAAFAKRIAVATLEFENIPADAIEAAESIVPVRPSSKVLHTTQNRLREKTFLQDHGFPVPRFTAMSSEADANAAAGMIGFPAVLKTAGFGYDGKGQATVRNVEELLAARKSSGADCILEEFVDFQAEVSLLASRGIDSQVAAYPLIENHHERHILDYSVMPGRAAAALQAEAEGYARRLLGELEYVGILCIEFFVTKSGALLINELAPRPHNSGHLTIDACATSQFEQQVRAVCGLPLGDTRSLMPAAMANLLGDEWETGEPDWAAACGVNGVKLHLYGKSDPRPRRKMGHLTGLADSSEEALRLALAAREKLKPQRNSLPQPATKT